jgi:vacuolar-type H+-ATPase subunit C/Vma6
LHFPFRNFPIHIIYISFASYFHQFEADRRAIIITINSFGTELTKDDRAKLYPRVGKLHPDGLAALARADDYEQVKQVAEYYAVSYFHCY